MNAAFSPGGRLGRKGPAPPTQPLGVVLLVLHFSRKGGKIAHRKIAVGTKPAWLRLGTTVWQIQPAYRVQWLQLLVTAATP
jgi:hypothetical protein